MTPRGVTRGLQEKKSGSDLLSRAVSRGVPSALEGLTSVFGMGTGGTPPTLPPEKLLTVHTKGMCETNFHCEVLCLLPGPAPYARAHSLGASTLASTLALAPPSSLA